MNRVIFLLVSLLIFVNGDYCTDNDIDPNSIPTMTTNQMLTQLLTWCVTNATCTNVYKQSTLNITTFTFLIGNMLSGYTSLQQLAVQILCNTTSAQIQTQLWILKMIGQESFQLQCPPNFIASIDPISLTASCICQFDKVCTIDNTQNALLISLLGIAIGLIGGIFILTSFRVITELKPLKNNKEISNALIQNM
jgi:hypothetical protein